MLNRTPRLLRKVCICWFRLLTGYAMHIDGLRVGPENLSIARHQKSCRDRHFKHPPSIPVVSRNIQGKLIQRCLEAGIER